MLEAECIAMDPSAKGYASVDELFRDLKAWKDRQETLLS